MALLDRKIRLGVIANEFFDRSIGRVGGFGWAARQVSRVFSENPDLGVEVVFFCAERINNQDYGIVETGPHRVYVCSGWSKWLYARHVARHERIDVFLTIDYRPSYDLWLLAFPRVPVIIWSRDPRTKSDARRILSLRIPGKEGIVPDGIRSPDTTRLYYQWNMSRLVGRPMLIATKMDHLAEKIRDAYGVSSNASIRLPNPLDLCSSTNSGTKDRQPTVLFLGRLDPCKRPWLFVDLARLFPQYQFLVLGQSHFPGSRGWEVKDIPENMRFFGHIDGAAKYEQLTSAWVLVNTSIHEESPVSVFEALACETPVLSCTDWGNIVSRFGIVAGGNQGVGMDAIPALAKGLQRLMEDNELRITLGRRGREWVCKEHGDRKFIDCFRRACFDLGVGA